MKNWRLTLFIVLFFSALCSCRKPKQDPFESLINVQDITAGATCATGGILIQTGIDKNRNKVLDADEVQNSKLFVMDQTGPMAPMGQMAQMDRQTK